MWVRSGGEVVAVDSELAWVTRLVARATGGLPPAPERPAPADPPPTVRLRVEADTAPFDRTGLRPITRGAYGGWRRAVLHNAGGSGFDLALLAGDPLVVTARYRPSPTVRAANRLLARRFGLLAGQVLVHYPVLWRAGWRERVPLHACVVHTGAGTPLLAGPGGVGKSTLLAAILATGGTAISDNLCCADARACFGIAEPLRVDAAGARAGRTSHGRVERPLAGRVDTLCPDRVVVLERGPRTEIGPIEPWAAARVIVAGTYAAGELRRYWAFAASLALATGCGPAHPPIDAIARAYAARLPCVRVRVGDGDAVTAEQLCGEVLTP
jgi:hypothetical protein